MRPYIFHFSIFKRIILSGTPKTVQMPIKYQLTLTLEFSRVGNHNI